MFGFNKKKNEKLEASVQPAVVEPAIVEKTTVEDTVKAEKPAVESATPARADGHFESFREARAYLHQIKDCKHRIKLLEYRKSYRWNANMNTKMIDEEIAAEEAKMVSLRVEISDEISKLNDVRQEYVMTRRYVECLSWDQISLEMDSPVRTIQKIHGRALPLMNVILIEDGKIEVGEDNAEDNMEDDAVDAKAHVVGAKAHDYKEQFTSADAYPYQLAEEEPHEYFND